MDIDNVDHDHNRGIYYECLWIKNKFLNDMGLNRAYIWIVILLFLGSCNTKPVEVRIGNRVKFYMCSIEYEIIMQGVDAQISEYVERFYHCGEMKPEPISGALATYVVEHSVVRETEDVYILGGRIDKVDSLRARVMLDWKHQKISKVVIWHGAKLDLEQHFWVNIEELKKDKLEGSFALE